MADFKNKYPGYIDDLQRLMRRVSSFERIRQYKEYLKTKEEGTSDAQLKETIHNLSATFDYFIRLQGKVSDFMEMAPRLKEILKKEPYDINGDDERLLDRAGDLEVDILERMGRLNDIADCLAAFNEADGYSDLKSNELVADMYQATEEIAGISSEKRVLDRKADQLGLHERVVRNGIKTNLLVDRLNKLSEKTTDMSPYNAGVRYTNAKNAVTKAETYLKEVESEDTKKYYQTEHAKASKECQDTEEALQELSREKLFNENAIKTEEKNLEELKRQAGYEQDYMVTLGACSQEDAGYKKAYDEAKKLREKAENEFKYSEETLKNLSGSKKNVKAYYEKRMTYEKWKRTYEGFKEFLEKYSNNTEVMMVSFHNNGKSLEKIFSSNDFFKKPITEAKAKMAEILHWCPGKDVFPRTSDPKVAAYGQSILNKIKETMDAAQAEYKADESFTTTNLINDLNEKQNQLKKEDVHESELIGKQRDEFIELRDKNQLANTNDVDQIIQIQLDGEKQIADAKRAEAEAKSVYDGNKSAMEFYKNKIRELRIDNYKLYSLDVMDSLRKYKNGEITEETHNAYIKEVEKDVDRMSISDIISGYESDIASRKKHAEEFFPKKEYELRVKLSNATDKRKMYSESSLKSEISKAQEDLDSARIKENTAKEVKKEIDSIYGEYLDIANDRSDIYKTYKDKEYSKEYYISIRSKAQSFLAGFDSAKKSKNYKNSDQYEEISRTLTVLNRLKDDSSLEEYRRAITTVRSAAVDYIRAKEAQFRLFPSRQRIYRINYAKSIQKFCETQLNYLSEAAIDAGGDAHDFMAKMGNLVNKDKNYIMEDEEFFSKYSKSVVSKEHVQENVDLNVYNPVIQNRVFETEEKKIPQHEIGRNVYNSIYEGNES